MATSVYRLAPRLWQRRMGDPYRSAWSVYAIDRMPDGPLAAYVWCECPAPCDPAAVWDAAVNSGSSVWYRLRLPNAPPSGGNDAGDGVTWERLPALLTWALANGYALVNGTDLTALRPGRDVWLSYTSS